MTTLTYPHTLVAGTPENVNDLNDNLNAVTTWAAGNIDATNLAATAKPATLKGDYELVGESSLLFSSSFAAATYSATKTAAIQAIGTTAAASPVVLPINLPDFAVSGLTTQFRIQALTMTNATAPAMNFTFGVALIMAQAGGSGLIGITTIGSVLGAVTATAPPAATPTTSTGVDFTIAGSGAYVLVVTTSGTPAVNSVAGCTVRLQVHHI